MSWSDRSYADEGPLFRSGGGPGPTVWLVGINVVVSIVLWLVGGGAGGDGAYDAVLALGFRTDIGVDALWQLWRPFSYQFIHGDVRHLLFNMLMLWFTGRMLEEVFGPRRLVALFLGFGAVGALGQVVHQLIAAGPLPPVIGASGSIMGLVVLLGFTFPRRRIIFIVVEMSCAVFAALLVGIDLLALVAYRGEGGTAHSVHLAGAFAGFAFARLWPRLEGRVEDLKRQREHRKQQAAADSQAKDEAEMDRILEKINTEGMAGLSERERSFLKKQSERLRRR
ncbi:MAG: rhomboid family intramembrane serine protease [Planctomycetes bacterium]|nr:rhomboid family intramembrane serine protease [Planctomycetota bacterium]